MMSARKRSDLQGIRGFAIIFVLLFHFFPKQFPNGYIGVDQFFVLSGYLITMVLIRERNINFETIMMFYYRRIKRIIPLYALVILCILFFLRFCLPVSNFDANVSSAWKSLFFIANLQDDNPEMAYGRLLEVAENAFTHTWSLAVEIQFYLMVPIIFYTFLMVSTYYRSCILAALITVSATYQLTTEEYTAFNSVFSRLWQFSIGIYSFLVTNIQTECTETCGAQYKRSTDQVLRETRQEEHTQCWRATVTCLFGVLVVLALTPGKVIPWLLRIVGTTTTGLVIVGGTNFQSIILSNRLFVYFGDISYSLYLVHWPIYTYFKIQYTQSDMSFSVLFIGLFCSFGLAMLLTEFYEKAYLSAGKQAIYNLIFVLYVLCISFLLISDFEKRRFIYLTARNADHNNPTNMTVDEIIAENDAAMRSDSISLKLDTCKYSDSEGPFNWCEFKNITEAGRHNILILGNSYAPNAASLIYNNCKAKARRMLMYSAYGCEVVVPFPTVDRSWHCDDWYDSYLDAVKTVRPDVLFMIVRYAQFFEDPPSNNHVDLHLLNAKNRLREYEAFVKEKIFVLNAVPELKVHLVEVVNESLKMRKKVPQSSIGNTSADLARGRVEQLVKACTKCTLLDYMPHLTINGTYSYYDETNGLTYFVNSQHLTPHGLRKIEPVYKEACNTL